MRIVIRPLLWLKGITLALSTLLVASPAYSCGGILDVKCNLESGGMSPKNIEKQTGKVLKDGTDTATKAVQDVANAVNELQANLLTGPVLEQAIRASRDTAKNGAMPIPPEIRRQLTGYASEESMNLVLYKVGDNGFLNLARLLEQGGTAAAVTLIDVVVFRGQSDADDVALWAHELTHVDQYRDWGLRSFAVRYTRNANSVEDEAYAKGDGYYAWAQRSGPSTTIPTPVPPPPPPPPIFVSNPPVMRSGTMVSGCGCWGATTGFISDLRCASGRSMAVACQGFCPGGGAPYGWMCQ
ncbi:DUF4157 domain-containing protein [Pseudomonas sp. P66]|uniref:DUF4157 domain-containing protein n=1 Tax=Pseudomonas arcuscaelestis TaxID=2710591 RepID=A0ABS2BZH1_9PSED|nr:DUF4157 domain-containing protein [Pseudomonas arcuscaelestis]MBM5459031.1 DUF4157 domain-containing protein [Pseudomonas arcuscaelestis]